MLDRIEQTLTTFCSYDMVTKRDIRVEISFPGSTNVIAYDQDGERSTIKGSEWNYIFVSSQLRSFYQRACYVGRSVQLLQSISSFEDFLIVVRSMYE